HRVVETQALDGATVALVAAVGDDDVVEGALLGAAASQSDLDHCAVCSVVLGGPAPEPGRSERAMIAEPRGEIKRRPGLSLRPDPARLVPAGPSVRRSRRRRAGRP